MEKKFSRGFTAVEMMVVIAIVGIMAAVAIPSFARLINENSVGTGTDEFLRALSFASRSAQGGRLVTICRSTNPESGAPVCSNAPASPRTASDWGVGWLIFEESSSSTNVGTFEAGDQLLGFHAALPSSVNVIGNKSTITFKPDGRPVGSLTGAKFTLSSSGNFMRIVCIDRSGSTRVLTNATVCPSS